MKSVSVNLSIINSMEGRIEVREGKRFFIYGTLRENTWQPELLLSQLDLTFLSGAPDPTPEWRDELGVCMMELCIPEDKVHAIQAGKAHPDAQRLPDFAGPTLTIPGQIIGFETRRDAVWVQIDGGRWRVHAKGHLQPGADCLLQIDPSAITWRALDGRVYSRPEATAPGLWTRPDVQRTVSSASQSAQF